MTTFTAKWLIDLTRLGARRYNGEDVNRIVFTNVVFICLPIVYLIFVLIDYKTYIIPLKELQFDQFVIPIIIGICILGLWLNHLHQTTLSRVLFVSLWPLLLHLIPIKILEAPTDYYLAFPFGIVFHSMLIQLMFSYRSEKIPFLIFLSVNLAAMIFAPSILTLLDTDRDIPAEMLNDRYYFFDGILYWLLFNLVTFYILFIVDTTFRRLQSSNKMIEKQKEELKVLNDTLQHLVSSKTSELNSKNEKLRLHAFYNAHLLRGPFCRVSGLVDLLDKADPGSRDKKEVKELLDKSLEELDSRIEEIQRVVEDSEEKPAKGTID